MLYGKSYEFLQHAVSDAGRARFAALRVKLAYHDIFEAMGINEVRERLRGQPNAESVTMQYGEHGAQIFTLGDRNVTLPPMASDDEVIAALTINTLVPSMSDAKPTGISDFLAEYRAQKAELVELKTTVAAETSSAIAAVKDELMKARKEASDIRAELGQVSNGGPA